MMVSNLLIKSFAFAFLGQLLPASIFVPLQTEKYYDLCGSLGFLSTTLFSLYNAPFHPTVSISHSTRSTFGLIRSRISSLLLQSSSNLSITPPNHIIHQNGFLFNRHPRQIIVSVCVLIWSIRLGTFLFKRIQTVGHDKRFNQIKKDPFTFSFAWFMQSIWIILTALPVYMINALPSTLQPKLGIVDYIGIFVWLSGLTFEIIADQTKSQWRKEKDLKKHNEKFIKKGVWSLCRHPNYFGEIVLWFGLAILSSSTFSNQHVRSYISSSGQEFASLAVILSPFLSPLFEYCLIRYLSGVPMLERDMNRKLKGDKKYAEYKETVPCFIPFIGSKR